MSDREKAMRRVVESTLRWHVILPEGPNWVDDVKVYCTSYMQGGRIESSLMLDGHYARGASSETVGSHLIAMQRGVVNHQLEAVLAMLELQEA